MSRMNTMLRALIMMPLLCALNGGRRPDADVTEYPYLYKSLAPWHGGAYTPSAAGHTTTFLQPCRPLEHPEGKDGR